jgi:lipocalin
LKLKVFLFTVDFQIIDIDQENYNYALVTSDEGKNLWIFSRSPVMDPRDYKKMMDSARDKGFEVASLEKVSQTSNSAYAER